jgi:pantoate--beta-alanine ligase
MKIIKNIVNMREEIKFLRCKTLTIGFVATMGYLHQGHLSLIERSKSENDITIMSIFVNPIQFGENEDFSKYPRDLNRDIELADMEAVDFVFIPEANELYPGNYSTYVIENKLSNVLCGKSRPTHFKGVTTIVNKLFNIIKPDRAYFGQKDYQQYLVLKKMTEDLNMDIDLIVCPILREFDGLALSSRNIYLNNKDRAKALSLSKSLKEAEKIINNGEKSKGFILKYIKKYILSYGKCDIEYVEILNADDLSDVKIIENKILIAVAVKYGPTRLIDNVVLEVE